MCQPEHFLILLNLHQIKIPQQHQNWKKRFEKLQHRTGEIKEISDLYGIDENYFATTNTLLMTLKGNLDAAVYNI